MVVVSRGRGRDCAVISWDPISRKEPIIASGDLVRVGYWLIWRRGLGGLTFRRAGCVDRWVQVEWACWLYVHKM